jgi:hypothetical protein
MKKFKVPRGFEPTTVRSKWFEVKNFLAMDPPLAILEILDDKK